MRLHRGLWGEPRIWGQRSCQFTRWNNLANCPRGWQQYVQVVKTLLNLGKKATVSFNLGTGFIPQDLLSLCMYTWWRIPWREEPVRQESMGAQRVGHNLAIKQHAAQVQVSTRNTNLAIQVLPSASCVPLNTLLPFGQPQFAHL